MNIFRTQIVRDRHKVEWQEEYIVGMISQIGPMNAMRVLNVCSKQKVMSPATTHKYLKAAARKRLLSQKIGDLDRREVEYAATPKGNKFLQDIADVYRLRSSK